jgi:RHS repeat-associated protein
VLPNAARHDKLCSVASNFPDEGNVTYEYGGDGKRRTRTAGSVGNAYWWDAGYNVIEEAVGASPATPNIHYVIDHPASSRGNVLADIQGTNPVTGTPRYYSHDHLGSTRTLRNQAKATLARFDYDPYGAPVSQGASATRTYTGHDFDSTAGMYFAPYRYYAPGMARWTERDPLGLVDGPNLYVYVAGEPVNLLDPLGQSFWKCFGEGLLAGALNGLAIGTLALATATVLPTVATLGLGALAVIGGTTILYNVITNPSQDNIGYSLGAVTGGAVVGFGLAKPLQSGTSPLGAKPTGWRWWDWGDRFKRTPGKPFIRDVVGWGGTGTNPQSGMGATALAGSGVASDEDPSCQ